MTADSGAIEAARRVIAGLGLQPEQLLEPATAAGVPTFSEYIPQVADAVSSGARRTYQPYWDVLLKKWPDRRLDEPIPTELLQLALRVQENAYVRRNSRDGRSAVEHFIAAARCIYRHAERDRLITHVYNPAADVSKPRRLPSLRRALSSPELVQINTAVGAGGSDPSLDCLLLRFHTETACRRGGALALRDHHDLDPDQCLVKLHEKGLTTRWQPVSPTLMCGILEHIDQRPATEPDAPVFRYRDGRPISRRRYDSIWARVGRIHPWVARQSVSTHWVRHTTLTWVERNFGFATAEAFAGHETSANPSRGTSTGTYVKATLQDVATALAALTGEPHPIAQTGSGEAGDFVESGTVIL